MVAPRITNVLVLLVAIAAWQPASAQRGGGAAVNLPPMSGLWERSSSYRAGGDLSEHARALKENQTVFDDPEFYCKGYNVVRFTLNEDNTRLDYVPTSHDPVMYTEPLVDRSHWTWRPGARAPATGSCELWTEVGEGERE